MTSRKQNAKHSATLLYNGSVLYINAIGGGWSVDVFGDDNVDDLIYHAMHATEQDALDDLDSWKQWDD